MSNLERKRFLAPSTGYSSTKTPQRRRFVSESINRSAVGGYGPCYPKISEKLLKVYIVSNEQRPELPVLEEKVRERETLSMRQFKEALNRVLQNDCVTLGQMVDLADNRPMGAGIADTLFTLKSEPEAYTIYALKSITKMLVANLKGRLSDVGHDPQSFDRFPSKLTFDRVESVVVASTPMARDHWRRLNDGMIKNGHAFNLRKPLKQLTVLMLARLSVTNRFHIFTSEPKSAIVIPENLSTTIDSVLEDVGSGNMQFDLLVKAVLESIGMTTGAGIVRYMRELDWSARSARLVRAGENVLEKEINSDDLPPERRTVVANNNVESCKLIVMLRLRCKIRKCNARFKNDYTRTEHMKRQHSYTTEDIKIATDFDATNHSQQYEIVDEHAWLKEHPFLEDVKAGEVHPEFVRRSTEFCEIHTENLFRLTMLKTELDMWKNTTVMDDACIALRNWRQEMLEEGRRFVVDEERFNGIVALSTVVSRRRIDENRNDTLFRSSMKKSLDENPMVRLARMNEADYDVSVQNNDGIDVSGIQSKSLSYDDVTLQHSSRRSSVLSVRLLQYQLDPDGETAVQNARKRAFAMYGEESFTSYKQRKKEDNDEDDDDDEKSCSTSLVPGSVPLRCLLRGHRRYDRDPDGGSLVEMNPTAIRVHRLDAYKDIKNIVDDIMDDDNPFGRSGVGHAMTDVVNFTESKFKLTKAGRNAALRYCFGQVEKICNLDDEVERRHAVVSIFSDVFKFFNSNRTGRLNQLFAKRKYERLDPSMEVVEVDESQSYETPCNESPLVEIPTEGLRISMEYDQTTDNEYAEKVVRFQCEMCMICRYEFGCRSVEAIPCAAIARARAIGKSAPEPRELIESVNSDDSVSEWNGVHLFHTSCLREMIRDKAKDTRAKSVKCPTCRATFYDANALNVVRMKLVQSKFEGDIEDYEDDVFNAKSELGRDHHFLVSCQQDLDRLKDSVRKLYKQKNMRANEIRADATNKPYEIGPVCWYTDSKDDVSEDVDKFIAKLKMENRLHDSLPTPSEESDYPTKNAHYYIPETFQQYM